MFIKSLSDLGIVSNPVVEELNIHFYIITTSKGKYFFLTNPLENHAAGLWCLFVERT